MSTPFLLTSPRLALAAVAAVAAVAATSAPAQAPAPAAAAFERFFIGTTHGTGTVKVMLSGAHSMRDRSQGRMDKGALILDQVVEEQGKPARRRSWRLVRSGANGITGSISDARGAVTGDVKGNVLHLKYRMAEGPSVEQWITLHAGGRSATNKMVFHRFGMKVATVDSTLRKID